MKTLPKTSTHLNVCGSNFFKLRKLLQDFKDPMKSFEKSVSKNETVFIKFNLLSKTKHTLTYEVKHIHTEDSLNDFIIRFKTDQVRHMMNDLFINVPQLFK